MTATATFGGTAEAALANKKQMRTVLVENAERAPLMDRAREIASRARSGAMGVLKALKLDNLAAVMAKGVKTAFSVVRSRLAQGLGLFNRVVGWTNFAGWLLTHKPTRDTVGDALSRGIGAASRGAGKVAGWVARVPLIGKPLAKGLVFITITPLAYAQVGLASARTWIDSYEGSSAARWLQGAVKLSLLGRLVKVFVPARFRTLAYAGGMVGLYGRKTVGLLERGVDEVEEFNTILDQGLKVVGTMYQVEIVKTGQQLMLPITSASDSTDVKVVTWEGKEYDITTLGDLDTDPIRPTIDQRARNANGLGKKVAATMPSAKAQPHKAPAKHGPPQRKR